MTIPTTREIREDFIWCHSDTNISKDERLDLEEAFDSWMETVKAQALRDILTLFPGKNGAWVRDRIKDHIATLEDEPYKAGSL